MVGPGLSKEVRFSAAPHGIPRAARAGRGRVGVRRAGAGTLGSEAGSGTSSARGVGRVGWAPLATCVWRPGDASTAGAVLDPGGRRGGQGGWSGQPEAAGTRPPGLQRWTSPGGDLSQIGKAVLVILFLPGAFLSFAEAGMSDRKGRRWRGVG